MRSIDHTLYLLLGLLLCIPMAQAQEQHREFSVGFRVGSAVVDSGFADNAERISGLNSYLQNIRRDNTLELVGVCFSGTYSPEGDRMANIRLAMRRRGSLETFVRNRIELSDSIITLNDEYISLDDFRQQVAVSDIIGRERATDILEEYAAATDEDIDRCFYRLRWLNGGASWRQMKQSLFGNMRLASVVFTTREKVAAFRQVDEPECRRQEPYVAITNEPMVIGESADSVAAPFLEMMREEEPSTEAVFRRRLLLKSNAVGWVLGISNIAVEVDLAPRWSFTLPAYYSGWNYFTSTVKFRTTALQPEVRYWFSESNDSWYVGAHFGMAYYNYANGGSYRYQDHKGNSPALGGGISAGYRLPFKSNPRWRVEFSVGAGVYSLHYDKFHNPPRTADGMAESTHRRTFFGIDQLAVAFSYSFDLQKKGAGK